MRKIVFDIETRNVFADVGKHDPSLLDIALIAIHDSETGAYSTYLEEDLNKLWPLLERADILIGYNSEHFDTPLLNKYYPGDLSKIKSIDLMKEVQKVYGRRLKLDHLSEATLGKRKLGQGLDAIKWWKQGEIEKIREYCVEDVKITKELYDYAYQFGHLKYKDGANIVEIALDCKAWEEPAENKLTFTLPF